MMKLAADLSFVANGKAAAASITSKAGCLLVPIQWPKPSGRTVIRVADPRAAFAKLIRVLKPAYKVPPGIHPTAVVDASAEIGDGVVIGAGCVVGRDVRIGPGTRLYPNVVVYDEVRIGLNIF